MSRINVFFGGLVILLLSLLIACGSADHEKQVMENFSDNQKNEPYARKVPLSEMDFEVYAEYFPTATTLIQYNYNRKISLPCDVEYYCAKEDSAPAVTLKEGTEVYIMSDDEIIPDGYGMICWPDYEDGWRYGQPFLTEDFSDSSVPEGTSLYYVREEQLEKVAEAFYKSNQTHFEKKISADDYVKKITRYIDQILYDNGAYVSNSLLKK